MALGYGFAATKEVKDEMMADRSRRLWLTLAMGSLLLTLMTFSWPKRAARQSSASGTFVDPAVRPAAHFDPPPLHQSDRYSPEPAGQDDSFAAEGGSDEHLEPYEQDESYVQPEIGTGLFDHRANEPGASYSRRDETEPPAATPTDQQHYDENDVPSILRSDDLLPPPDNPPAEYQIIERLPDVGQQDRRPTPAQPALNRAHVDHEPGDNDLSTDTSESPWPPRQNFQDSNDSEESPEGGVPFAAPGQFDRTNPDEPIQRLPQRDPLVGVSKRVAETCRGAFDLARRGSIFAARARYIRALNQLVQALDLQQRGTEHQDNLRLGLTALKEVNDFVPPGGKVASDRDVADAIQFHKTPVLKSERQPNGLTATQTYLSFAQVRLAKACANVPVGSLALHGLGKIELALQRMNRLDDKLHSPKAMALFQAALMTDDNNYLAANELGVLLARFGRWQDAAEVLNHGLSINPHAEAFHNLAVVQKRLGQDDLAEQSRLRAKELAKKLGPQVRGHQVKWVDLKDFTAAGPDGPKFSRPTVVRPASQKRTEQAPAAPKKKWGWRWPWQ